MKPHEPLAPPSWLVLTEAGRLYVSPAVDGYEAADNARIAYQCVGPYVMSCPLPARVPVCYGQVRVAVSQAAHHRWIAVEAGSKPIARSFGCEAEARAHAGHAGLVIELPYDMRIPPLAGEIWQRASGATLDVDAALETVRALLFSGDTSSDRA